MKAVHRVMDELSCSLREADLEVQNPGHSNPGRGGWMRILCRFALAIISFSLTLDQGVAQWESTGLAAGSAVLLGTDSLIFAGLNDQVGTGYGYGVMATNDQGQTWTGLENGLSYRRVLSLAHNSSFLFAGTERGVFRSGDNGQHWILTNTGLGDNQINSILAGDSIVLAATAYSGIFVSKSNGIQWSPLSNGLPVSQTSVVTQLRGYFFAATGAGVYRSGDGGKTWERASAGMSLLNVQSLVVADSMLFAISDGVYRSTDLGTNWTPQNAGLEFDSGNYLPVGLGTDGTEIFLSRFDYRTSTTALFLSRNHGDTWIEQSDGLAGRYLTGSALLVVQGTYIIMGTNNGVFRRPYSDITSAGRAAAGLPGKPVLEQNYPNPFNPTTKIRFTIVNRQLTSVFVFDLLGRKVATLVHEVKAPGTYTVGFGGSNLASGVYIYRLQAGDFVQTRRLVLLK
jgi:hypothetical protein